uniref:Ig-like domain-containing protein n=1 Tax=Scophthalmus maximus TaxID=52904 RepID=A0A8D3AXL8_SCOMX
MATNGPVFIQPITSCKVPLGEVARFHALVSSIPKPDISWFHNRQPVRPTRNIVFHFDEVTNTATLIIVDAFSEHAGQYTCRAANPAGEAACSATLTITKEEDNMKPSFTKKLKFQSVLEGEPVELKCKLIASPQPTILWFHNNRSIPKDRRCRICTDSKMHMYTTSLVIDSIKEKDSGSYKVMAINTEGSAESTASLLVSLREEAVKQKKRLSISTMSSSEFELESVTSEPSYTDYVERLRVKPASLPDVQHFNRPFDFGLNQKGSSRDPSRSQARHSFAPQSRTRA